MPGMLGHQNLGGVDFLRSRCLQCISDINGNAGASSAKTASCFARLVQPLPEMRSACQSDSQKESRRAKYHAALPVGINGNTAASMAIAASRFSSNMCHRA
jgi:hypothetical protein